MLPDLSPAHILIVIVVALIVVGPKDLPMLLRKIGQFMGRMRGMANEFRASFDEMARQSELDELRKEVEAMRAASQAALPAEFGGSAAAASDAESAYMANWQASHAEPTDGVMPGLSDPHSILPPTTMELAAAAKASKPAKASGKTKAPAKTQGAPESAAEAAPKAAKPRAKKAKSAGDAA